MQELLKFYRVPFLDSFCSQKNDFLIQKYIDVVYRCIVRCWQTEAGQSFKCALGQRFFSTRRGLNTNKALGVYRVRKGPSKHHIFHKQRILRTV